MRLPVTTEQFLAEYWQQQPLFCPQALPHFQSPMTAEELAGLAMEPDIDSRMVWQDSGIWHQQTGPFAENEQAHFPHLTVLSDRRLNRTRS